MRRFACVTMIFLAALRLDAAINETILSLSITNPSDFIIAADSLTSAAGTTRDAVHVRAVVRWSNDSFGTASKETEYQLQLLASNTAVRIVNQSQATNTVYRLTNSVTLGGFGQLTRTNFIALRPVDQLDPFLLHRVRLSLMETGSVTKDVSNTVARQFWHFTNLVSGDAAFNVLGSLDTNSWSKSYAITSLAAERNFEVTNTIRILRYDDFDAVSTPASIPVRLAWQLQDTNGSVIPVSPSSTNFTVSTSSFEDGSPNEPRDRSAGRIISFRPLTQLDSVSNRYRLVVTMSLTNIPGQPAEIANAITNTPTRLNHLSGTLLFGDVSATITNLIGEVISPPTPPGSDYVNITLDGSAILDAEPERDFDLAGPRTFRLQRDGSAYLPSGSLTVFPQLGGDYFTNGNVRIRRFTMSLSPDGATADLRFYLPAGFGLTTNYSDTRRFESQWTFPDVGLNSSLEPRSNLVVNASIVATTESKPILILAERLQWSTNFDRFTLTPNATFPAFGTRSVDEALLQARSNLLASPNLATKRANDGYYRFINGFSGSIVVTASAQGVAQFNFTAEFNDGSFSPHFPIGPSVSWTNGQVQISNNSVVSGNSSHLDGVAAIVQRYVANCIGCDGMASTNSFSITPSNRWLYFTRDGGLIAVREPGSPTTQDLRWGISTNTGVYAHRAENASDFTWHMPGHFVRGVDDTSGGENGPGVVHLTGVAATNLSVIERPYTPGYDSVGRADYGGFNIRSSPAGTSAGLDNITGTTVSFDRSARSKYYVRLAGVNGIHEAVPGSFPVNLTLLGYPFNFSNYGLAFRDNVNIESRTEGAVNVPYPAEITLPFEELKLNCAGGIESALPPPGGFGYRHLSYWNADILPQSIRFEGKPGEECDPTQAFLVLGVQAHASYVTQPLSGTIGFFANGSMIPPAFDLPGVGSRFELPSQFRFAGPAGSGDWVLTPVSQAYFTTNDYARATNGFLNFAGKINVPFFQDLKVHLHTGARTNGAPGNAEIYLSGGWPGSDNANVFGWSRNNEHYFNEADFDDVNRGFPDGVDINDYHNSANENFRARAQRSWLEVVDFDYPLSWDPALRRFSSWKSVDSPLLVINAQHQVTYLDPKQAIIDIGPRYEGLPVVTLTHFLVDESSEGAGAASAMRDAVGQSAYSTVTNGLATADAILSENPTRLIDRLMVAGVDPVVSNLMSSLTAQWNNYKDRSPNQRAQFKNVATATVGNYFLGGSNVTDTIRNRVRYLGVTNYPLGGQLFTQLKSDVSQIAGGITANANGFSGGPVGASAIRKLVAFSDPQYSSAVSGPELEAALSQNSSTFDQLRGMMLNAQSTIASFTNVGGISTWKDELDLVWNSQAPRFDLLTQNAADAVADIIGSFNWRLDDPLSGSGAAVLKQRIRSEISDRLLNEAAIAAVRNSIKYRLFDANANYRSAANSLFAQYNTVARDLISRSMAQVDNSFAPGLGILERFFSISRVQGHAEIQDESLRELRIDGRFKIQVPDDMAFNAYLEIKELNSQNTPEACLPPNGDVATEVKFGATDVELDWISDGLRADVGTKINLVGGNAVGFAGSLQTRGPLEFAGFVIKQVGFAMAFGQEENYIAGNARVKLGQSSEIAGGLFFGRACDIDPLTMAVMSVSPFLLAEVNPKNIFGEPPFTGGFVYGEGMFPVFSVGCIFEVRLIAGAGGWFFAEGPRFGGIIKAGISGTVVCVLSAEGDVTLIGSRRNDGMAFIGMAHVEGCIGLWPLEVCIDGSTSVKYVEGREWDADEP